MEKEATKQAYDLHGELAGGREDEQSTVRRLVGGPHSLASLLRCCPAGTAPAAMQRRAPSRQQRRADLRRLPPKRRRAEAAGSEEEARS